MSVSFSGNYAPSETTSVHSGASSHISRASSGIAPPNSQGPDNTHRFYLYALHRHIMTCD